MNMYVTPVNGSRVDPRLRQSASRHIAMLMQICGISKMSVVYPSKLDMAACFPVVSYFDSAPPYIRELGAFLCTDMSRVAMAFGISEIGLHSYTDPEVTSLLETWREVTPRFSSETPAVEPPALDPSVATKEAADGK